MRETSSRAVGRRSRRLVTTIVALVVALVVGLGCGCSASRGAEPADRTAPVLLRSAGLELPLDPYLLTPGQVDELSRAHRALVERCMAGLGFDAATAASQDPKGPAGLRSLNERRYGLTDADQAADLGYHLGDRDPAARTPKETGGYGPAEADALTGEGADTVDGHPVPEGGCTGEAQRELRADGPGRIDRSLAQRLSTQSYGRSRRDSRVRDVVREWSACMAERGFDYADPFEPMGEPRFQRALSAAEVSTAKADVSCKRETNLVGVWFTVESSYQRRLVKEHRDALQRLRQAAQNELAVARTVRGH